MADRAREDGAAVVIPLRRRADDASATHVRLRLFGAFRELAGPELAVTVPAGTTVADLRLHVKSALARRRGAAGADELVDASVLASDGGILPESRPLATGDVFLSILPPVCGG